MPLYILFSTWLKDIEWLRLNISEICGTRLELFYNVDMYMRILNYSNFSNIWLYYVIMIIIYDNFFCFISLFISHNPMTFSSEHCLFRSSPEMILEISFFVNIVFVITGPYFWERSFLHRLIEILRGKKSRRVGYNHSLHCVISADVNSS